MSFDAVRQQIQDTLQSELSMSAPGVPVYFENTKFQQPGEGTVARGPWIFCAIAPNVSQRADLSQRLFFHMGVINVSVMVPQDTGTKVLFELSEKVFVILADRNWSLPGSEDRLTTYGTVQKNRGLMNGHYTFSVIAQYRHEARHPR